MNIPEVVLFLSATMAATVRAQAPKCDAQAVASEPTPVDSLYPPVLQSPWILSSGARMNAVLYVAQGREPHPTVLLLHGFPGYERNADLAQAVRRAGFNVLLFHPRGAWGSQGTYSNSHVMEDVAAALAWLRRPVAADSYRINPGRLILVGHSGGGFHALHAAAMDNGVRSVAALAPVDMGRRGGALKDSAAFAAAVHQRESLLGPIRALSARALIQELADHATEWQLERLVPVLARKRMLLIAATHDGEVPLSEVYTPFTAALRKQGAAGLTTRLLDSDHAFSSSRLELARIVITWLCGDPAAASP
jgi:pimeloyl-ACP methyl ester carboxylesterase